MVYFVPFLFISHNVWVHLHFRAERENVRWNNWLCISIMSTVHFIIVSQTVFIFQKCSLKLSLYLFWQIRKRMQDDHCSNHSLYFIFSFPSAQCLNQNLLNWMKGRGAKHHLHLEKYFLTLLTPKLSFLLESSSE